MSLCNFIVNKDKCFHQILTYLINVIISFDAAELSKAFHIAVTAALCDPTIGHIFHKRLQKMV